MATDLPAFFVADAPGLDFLNSIATPVDAPVDWIGDGAGFLDWLGQAGLVPGAVLADLAGRALPGEMDKVADQARVLREWFRGFVRRHMGRALNPAALGELGPLQRLLERDEMFQMLGADGTGRLTLGRQRRWRTPEALLLPVGEILAQLVVAEDFAMIKACEGSACTLMFADHTRGHARRWCSMAVCGNRAKQAAHRARAKDEAGK